MADQRIQSTERMVGAGHATLADTLNRLALVEHNTDGTHKNTAVVLAGEKGAVNGVAQLDASGTVPDAQIPALIARDTEVTAAITTHEAGADPHAAYQKESEKGAVNGYAGLDASALVPLIQIPATLTGKDADTVDGSHASAFALLANGVTNGDAHDHAGGDGAQINHTGLANIGTNTHAQLDTHLASTSNPHVTTDVNLVTSDITTNNVSITKHGFAPKAPGGTTQFLRGDAAWAVPAGGGGSANKEWSYFRNVGVTPFESWYVAAQISVVSVTVGSPTANNMRAVPFMSGRGGTLDRIGIEVTTAVAGNIRIGIYDNTSDTYLYPNNLLVDSGDINTSTTGMKTAIINPTLNPNSLYWFVILNDAAPALRYITGGGCAMLLGVGPIINSTMYGHLMVSQIFGALPATFTTGGGPTATGTAPAISCRYSA